MSVGGRFLVDAPLPLFRDVRVVADGAVVTVSAGEVSSRVIEVLDAFPDATWKTLRVRSYRTPAVEAFLSHFDEIWCLTSKDHI
jgi:hypothetical protein